MVTCGTLVKIWTAAIVIAMLVWTGTVDGEKLSSCCKTVTRSEVTDPITGYWTQAYNAPCVRAVIFETKKGLICCHYKQPWVRRKIQQFEMARRSSTSPSLTSSPTTTSLPSSFSQLLFPSFTEFIATVTRPISTTSDPSPYFSA
ncbi:uncharacterized protein ACWYII_034854 [Salvelinus alpinus]